MMIKKHEIEKVLEGINGQGNPEADDTIEPISKTFKSEDWRALPRKLVAWGPS
jgi:hypothetical protein